MDALVGVPSALVGGAIFLVFYSWNAMTKEIFTFVAFVLAPAGIFFVCAFLWNLFLASDELLYESIKSVQVRVAGGPSRADLPVVNWSIWKQMPKFTVAEFAAILARRDPAVSRSNSEQQGYLRLIFEDIQAEKLRYVVEYRERPYTDERYERALDEDSSLLREIALKWAHEKGIDVSHIE